MPKINDDELLQAKKERELKIKKRFNEMYDKEGKRMNVILRELVYEFYLSQSSIMKILKKKD